MVSDNDVSPRLYGDPYGITFQKGREDESPSLWIWQLTNPGLVLVFGKKPRELETVIYANFFLQHSLLGEGDLEIYLPRVGAKPPIKHCLQTPAHLRHPSVLLSP